MLGAVIRAGYDRPFGDLGAHPAPGLSHLLLGCSDIEIDGNAIRLPAHTGFDPGGIGKGLAADMVATEMIDAGADGVCVNLGGDLRVIGAAAQGDGWTVAVEHPWADEPVAHVGLRDGAIATSTTLLRRWQIDDETLHHLIDPGPARPSDTDLASVTVVAGTRGPPRSSPKAVLLRGSSHPFDLIGGLSVEALAVDDTGRILTSAGFSDYLGADPVRETVLNPPEDRLTSHRPNRSTDDHA